MKEVHRFHVFKVLLLVLIISTQSTSSTQTFKLDGPYFSFGYSLNFHINTPIIVSSGPEISIGRFINSHKFMSALLGLDLTHGNHDWSVKSKLQYGYYEIGWSAGPFLASHKGKKKFGADIDFWFGMGLYGMVTYKLNPAYSWLSTSGKIKTGFPLCMFSNFCTAN